MSPTIEILDPTNDAGWDKMVASHDQGGLFHTAAWARVLSETYSYRPCYIVVREGDRLMSLIPMMEVRSVFGGKRGVSLPFTDYCSPIVTDPSSMPDLIETVTRYAQCCGWESFEIRGEYCSEATPSTSFYRHVMKLDPCSDQLFEWVASNTRRNVRKAIREGVEVRMSTSMEAVDEYYRLHCMTRKRHGVPPQPRTFFRMIHKHIISRGMGTIALAQRDGVNISGSVFFGFNGKAIYKFGASDYAHQNVRPADLVMWEGIRFHAEAGYRSFCFGRTEMENEGLRQFKRRWGAEEEVVNYFKYDVQNDTFLTENSMMGDIHHRVFRKMPIPVLKMVGSLLYKHMG